MEDLTNPVALNHEMVQTLDHISAGAENALYGASPAQAEELFKKHLAPMVVGSGMPVLQVMHYQWFLRELARLWRTRKGRDLAFHLELTIRKDDYSVHSSSYLTVNNEDSSWVPLRNSGNDT